MLLHFSLGEILAIFKQKGSRRDACKYRGITLSSILINILVNVILVRVSAKYEVFLDPGQMGFRAGKGTIDGIYCIKREHQSATERSKLRYDRPKRCIRSRLLLYTGRHVQPYRMHNEGIERELQDNQWCATGWI